MNSDKSQRIIHQETPIEETMKYLHLRDYLINAKKIRETWISASKDENKLP